MRQSLGAGVEAAGFFASVMSGFLLGFLADKWLGTDPLLVVIGIVAGSATGFWKMWQIAKRQDDQQGR
jgi:F0F1-type ATP synthase assembly protein I